MERQQNKEIIQRGQLYFLSHPSEQIFWAYGLTAQAGRQDRLVGLLMVDRPHPVDPVWLAEIEAAYGEYQLVPMTATGERGVVCQMRIEKESVSLLRQWSDPTAKQIAQVLKPLLDVPPHPILKLHWDNERRLWVSKFWIGLPPELQAMFEATGAGCFAAERGEVVAFLTHAQDKDIESFRHAPVYYQWQLIEMPTAPVIRFAAAILDDPQSFFRLEHFLNVADPDQARCLAKLVSQEEITFDFFGEDYEYVYSKYLPHPEKMRAELHNIVIRAIEYGGDHSSR